MTERMIEANGVELCAEPFGDDADPALLLVMGQGASMIWWEDGLCRMLADGGRFVIRYDHRDTGRSVAYEPGHPPYSNDDLVADAAGVLDAFEVETAHVVGLSGGGAIVQLLALDYPDRVASLVLISTSSIRPGLPSISERYAEFLAGAEVDWSDPDSVTEHVVADCRALSGGGRRFDEPRVRGLAACDVARARNFASAQNHAAAPGGDPWWQRLGSIAAPTLVIHGSDDPFFLLAHGEALAAEIPGARLLVLEGAGHGLDRDDWETAVAAVLEHTASAATR